MKMSCSEKKLNKTIQSVILMSLPFSLISCVGVHPTIKSNQNWVSNPWVYSKLFPIPDEPTLSDVITKNFKKGRTLAAQGPKCFKDSFTIERAKTEIAEYEKNWPSERVFIHPKRYWRNFKLAMMSPPQASFLVEFGELFGHQMIPFKCGDIYCILDCIYGQYDAPESVLTYLWYLKTRTAISTLDATPGYSRVPGLSLAAYHFNKEELLGLWKLISILPKQYLSLSTLASFHRFARGYQMTGGVGSAHLASGNYSVESDFQGFNHYVFEKQPAQIILNETDLSEKNGILKGQFFLSALHELSHSLDFYMGPQVDVMNYSETLPWLDLSWRVADARFQRGVTRTYQIKNNAASFLRPYSRTSPQEDFADSMTSFRLDYANALKFIPKKAEWISKNFYNGRTFDPSGLTKTYKEAIINALRPNLISYEEECGGFNTCFKQKAQKNIEFSVNTINFEEMEGCSFFESDQGPKLLGAIQNELSDQLALAHQEKNRQDTIALDLEHFKEQIKTLCDPRQIYVEVRRQDTPERVYLEQYEKCLRSQFKSFKSLNLVVGLEDQEVNRVLNLTTYTQALLQARGLFAKVLGPYTIAATKYAQKRWDQCVEQIKQASPAPLKSTVAGKLLSEPFNIQGREIDPELLQCVNDGLKSAVAQEMKEYLGPNLGSVSEEVLSYVAEIVMPTYLGSFQTEYNKLFLKEWSHFSSAHLDQVEKLMKELEKNDLWIKLRKDGSFSNIQLKSKCLTEFLSLMHKFFDQGIGEGRFLATRVEEIFEKWQDEACSQVIKRPLPLLETPH